MSDDRTDSPVPQRRLDAEELRALAHPLRLRLLEELMLLGEATATQLSERLEESPANCSWHLRQLARYGFIEDTGGGRGRERPWRWVRASLRIAAEDDASAESHIARETAVGVILNREIEAWRTWQVSHAEAPQEWREASFDTSTVDWVTPEELAELKQEVHALVERHVQARLSRIEPARRPPEARLVRFVTWAFPAGPVSELADGAEDDPDRGAPS